MLAVLLMPLTMAAPAAAAHPPVRMTMAMDHCPQQVPTNHSKAMFASCATGCALPAADMFVAERRQIASARTDAALAPTLDGLHPETATPPPRFS